MQRASHPTNKTKIKTHKETEQAGDTRYERKIRQWARPQIGHFHTKTRHLQPVYLYRLGKNLARNDAARNIRAPHRNPLLPGGRDLFPWTFYFCGDNCCMATKKHIVFRMYLVSDGPSLVTGRAQTVHLLREQFEEPSLQLVLWDSLHV